jgi:type I restriction enzyme S subunit
MPSSDVTPKGLAKASSIQLDNVILGGDMNILRPFDNFNSIYFSYLLNFNQQKIIQKVTGTTVKHIYNRDVKLLKFNIPTSIEEQKKIAEFLSAIDVKIESLNKQITQTQIFKKGLLQQMFV